MALFDLKPIQYSVVAPCDVHVVFVTVFAVDQCASLRQTPIVKKFALMSNCMPVGKKKSYLETLHVSEPALAFSSSHVSVGKAFLYSKLYCELVNSLLIRTHTPILDCRFTPLELAPCSNSAKSPRHLGQQYSGNRDLVKYQT